jgi:arylsulfatase A-like enzyme
MRERYRPWQVAFVIMSTTCAILPCRSGLTEPHKTTSVKSTDKRPNIVLIMADDMGYSDIGCYGGEIDTPNLNRLAEGGVRFTQFYNCGRCCPTRASLLTGLYPHQAGIGWMTTDRGHDGYRGDLNRNSATIAEVLRPAGYSTYLAGKWHVTKATQPDGPKDNWPLQRGFDRFYGTVTGAGSFFDPGTLTRDNQMISPFADPEYKVDTYYYTHAISDHANRFINEHVEAEATKNKPFFLYVSYTAAHWPMHALPHDIEKYRGKYGAGYEAIRRKRYERLLELGLIDSSAKMSAPEGDWTSLKHQAWEERCMEVYAAMVDSMDQGIGQIVKTLKSQGVFDDTLILFLQDNGGCQETVGRRGTAVRPAEPTLPVIPQNAIRTDVIPKQNRRGIATLNGPGVLPGPEDTYIAYGQNWAHVSNTPFREFKHFVHEGGISSPLIAHWPAKIANHGGLVQRPSHLIDIMATCIDLSGAEYPSELDGEKIHPPEGMTLANAWESPKQGRGAPLFWEHEGNRAVRDGNWKLVAKENKPWELYDLSTDRSELKDLASAEPARVGDLIASWESWAARANVLPLGTWRAPANKNRFSKKKRFQLLAGVSLAQENAPMVRDKALKITATLHGDSPRGVIVAQGGTAHGYALHLEDGKLIFAVRRDGKLDRVTGRIEKSTDSRYNIQVEWNADASVDLRVNGSVVGQGQLPGLLTDMPIDGLNVGDDIGGLVDEYTVPTTFTETIEKVTVQIVAPAKTD